MGGVLTCLATEAACCFGKAACSCFCKICGTRSSTATRVGYAFMFFVSAVLSWLMQTDWANGKLKKITHGYLELSCPQGDCYGYLAVIRICFATTLFHSVMAAMMYNVKSSRDFRSHIQNGFWAWKLLAWTGIVVASFFIPNGFFAFVGKWIDMPGALIFVMIQIVLLIDFAFTFTELMLEKQEERDDKRWLILLLTLTLGAFICSIVLTGFMYAWFGASPCKLNKFFITFNLLLCIIVTTISLLPVVQEANPKSGLAQSAMVTVYATYLIASAIVSEPNDQDGNVCNPTNETGKTQTTALVLGSIFTFLALAYSTTRAATKGDVLASLSSGQDEASVPLITEQPRGERSAHLRSAVESGALPSRALYSDDDDDDEGRGGAFGSPDDDEKDGVQYNYSFFHTIFILASMYLAMLLTAWQMVDKTDEATIIAKSMGAVWVKVISSWLSLGLFTWTLLAPVILPERFGA
ncbi:serine incorporator/TMS membrane protein [Phlyctochytrium arcticum]|nr:serine incorporator/TMS membrane protein [Phlyctochytrium arcticum]